MSLFEPDLGETMALLDAIADAAREVDSAAVQAAVGRAYLCGVTEAQIQDAIFYGRSKTPDYRPLLDVDDLRESQHRTPPWCSCAEERTPARVPTPLATITPALADVIEWVHIVTAADLSTLDNDLQCQLCDEIIGRVEDEPSIGQITRIALAHMTSCDIWPEHSQHPRPVVDWA
ncbi:hypothetical protein ACQPW1_10295 [Nocardia sp. CA-128927]|uniref:hypothetical protein n=1 Tax=Nocardia sp. CA-128927 TaxID=3239975 RepID=UPI003D98D84A